MLRSLSSLLLVWCEVQHRTYQVLMILFQGSETQKPPWSVSAAPFDAGACWGGGKGVSACTRQPLTVAQQVLLRTQTNPGPHMPQFILLEPSFFILATPWSALLSYQSLGKISDVSFQEGKIMSDAPQARTNT